MSYVQQTILTFAIDDVVKDLVRFELALYECEDKIFVAIWKHEAVEGLPVPRNIFHAIDVEFRCSKQN